MMPVFECNGCPQAPCILYNLDPEFEIGNHCPRQVDKPEWDAVWQEMKVVS